MYKINTGELYHHGILGQKWGIRRYQNPDGTLTEEGKARLEKYRDKKIKKVEKEYMLSEIKRDNALTRVGENSSWAANINIRYNKKGEKYLEEINRLKNLTFSDMLNDKAYSKRRRLAIQFIERIRGE